MKRLKNTLILDFFFGNLILDDWNTCVQHIEWFNSEINQKITDVAMMQCLN